VLGLRRRRYVSVGVLGLGSMLLEGRRWEKVMLFYSEDKVEGFVSRLEVSVFLQEMTLFHLQMALVLVGLLDSRP
jgi:hypothetical protein